MSSGHEDDDRIVASVEQHSAQPPEQGEYEIEVAPAVHRVTGGEHFDDDHLTIRSSDLLNVLRGRVTLGP